MPVSRRARSAPRRAIGMIVVFGVVALATPGSLQASAPPWRALAFSYRDLSWEALPFNGRKLLTLGPLPGMPHDGNLLPMIWIGGRRYYSPVRLTTFGLRLLDGYVRTHDRRYLDRAQLYARRLRLLGHFESGALYLDYPFDWRTEGLEAPWSSAMAQGEALAFFSRLHLITHAPADRRTADQLYAALRHIGRAGSRTWVTWIDARRNLWLEEYPARTPTHVLNGFIYAIFGVYDYYELTKSASVLWFLRGATTTIRDRVVDYRRPGRTSLYDLVHRTSYQGYHDIHVWQLRWLGAVTRDTYFTTMSRRLDADA